MSTLELLFPAKDFSLLAIMVALPLLGALVNGLFGKRLGNQGVSLMALSMVGASFVGAVLTFLALRSAQAEVGPDEAARLYWKGWEWMQVTGRAGSQVPIELAFSVDALSATMALVITGVGFLIHLYSTKYMESDPGYPRFFAYLNLFIFSMLVLVLGDSLPVLFIGWEGVGLCSYLLIGFWYQDDANAAAGKKAFIANRIGDFGLLVAMGMLVYYVGALDWRGIEAGAGNLVTPRPIWSLGSTIYVSVATLVSLALFLGAAGKSAQIPLYVWLPDAMAGPTPVSALIHAATMVTAGVYLVCRMSAVFVLSPAAMFTVAMVGALTALLAATIALVQNDIKKVLAYSTVSQLGFMFLGAGVGAFSAGFFHVLTHAFFKACLFLGAGSVIHAMHARIHATDASQDMRNMGGLKDYLPVTFFTFVAAWAAIVGLPLTSGFFSKDEILFRAYTTSIKPPGDGMLQVGALEVPMFQWPSWGPKVLFAMGVSAAVMTAFYMTRLIIRTFMGEFRGWAVVPGWQEPEGTHGHGHGHDHHEDEELEGPEPHESPWQMTLPLVVLGGLALVAGALNAHAFFHSHKLDDWLAPVFRVASASVVNVENAQALANPLIIPGVLAFAGGVGLAYWMYITRDGEPAEQLAERFPGLHALLIDKWRVDEFYEETIIGAVDSLADLAVLFDKYVVDGILARASAGLVAVAGGGLRLLQTGRVHAYSFMMVVGLAGFFWFFTMPHADFAVKADHGTGSYTLSAPAGLGYQYRWAEDGAEPPEFSAEAAHSFSIPTPGESKTVRLWVRNAFGRETSREFTTTRPKPDLSGGPLQLIDVVQGADGQLRAAPRQGGQP